MSNFCIALGQSSLAHSSEIAYTDADPVSRRKLSGWGGFPIFRVEIYY